MTEQVLTSEEVDAILKASKNESLDLGQLITTGNSNSLISGKHYTYALGNINEILLTEFEKNLSAFLRKRVIIKTKAFNLRKVDTMVNDSQHKSIYHIFRVKPTDTFGVVIIDYAIMHHSLNLIYGGILNPNEKIVETPGKIGVLVAEKIAQLCLASFINGCKDYGAINIEDIKTTVSPHLASNLGLNTSDTVYALEQAVYLDELETTITLLISENFLAKFIPPRINNDEYTERNSWQFAIKSQVEDSLVTVTATLPDIKMKIRDFMQLKQGDTIVIEDPTKTYLCLNHLKIFRGVAAQANDKRVIKITSKI